MAEIELFDGKPLNGGNMTGNPAGWEVVDGAIYCNGTDGGYLYTERKDFRDFELSLSFKHDEGANSGIFFRWTDLNDPVQTGIEIQIMDTHDRDPATTKCCGAMYDCQAPVRNTCRSAGEWNSFVLTANGPSIVVVMNDEATTTADLAQWSEASANPDGTPNKFKRPFCEMVEAGHIGFQGDHKGVIWFKDVKVKTL